MLDFFGADLLTKSPELEKCAYALIPNLFSYLKGKKKRKQKRE